MTDNAMFALIDSLQRKCAATELHICKPPIAVLNTVYSVQLDKLQSSQYIVRKQLMKNTEVTLIDWLQWKCTTTTEISSV